MNKRGVAIGKALIIIVAIIVILYLITATGGSALCSINEEEYNNKSKLTQFLYDKVLFCKIERDGFFASSFDKAKTFLGFDRSFYLIWADLANGLVIGALIFASYWLIAKTTTLGVTRILAPFRRQMRADIAKIQSSWLNLIGGEWWKIIPIAILYTILMQIPVINRAIEFVAFKPLGLSWFLQDVLIAFYVALLPGAIEAYSRFKLRKKYYHQIMEAKYGVRIAKGMTNG